MDDQVAPLLVVHLRLAHGPGEVDVLEDAIEVAVGVLESDRPLLRASPTWWWASSRRKVHRASGGTKNGLPVPVGIVGPGFGVSLATAPASSRSMTAWRSTSNWSDARFRNRAPKMYSLNSEASVLPRRMSAAKEMPLKLGQSQHSATPSPPRRRRCSWSSRRNESER